MRTRVLPGVYLTGLPGKLSGTFAFRTEVRACVLPYSFAGLIADLPLLVDALIAAGSLLYWWRVKKRVETTINIGCVWLSRRLYMPGVT